MSNYAPNRVHVLPVNDIMLHNEEGEYCHCNPKIEHLEYGVVVIHNAFREREFDQETRGVTQ